MKKYIYILIAAVGALLCTACHKITTADQSWVIYYPEIILEGDNPLVLSLGETFTDPGYSASLFGEDKTSELVVESDVNTSTFGIYSVTYTSKSKEGYPWSIVRDVFVLNPGNIDNLYKVKSSYGTRSYEFSLPVTKVSDGVYHIEDVFGGFYSRGRYPGYPYDFNAEADFKINPDNTVSLAGPVGPWYFSGDGDFDYTTFDGKYDPGTGVISWTIEGNFSITLTPFSI